ncbi:MAG: beta-galactosidase [Bacteroidales bacterium]|nr:beta-galactosidase [Bacteroidales bacterium]
MILTLLLTAGLPLWQDIQTTSVNAQTQRTEVIYYAQREDALKKGFRESENYRSLNGTWEFKYFDDYHQMETISADAPNWDSIRVPGNWEVQGWGIPIYTNTRYDFCPENPQPPQLPEIFPGAIYKRRFTVPAQWKDREVFLNLCGTKSGTYVYVNGQEVGYSEDSKDLARYRITDIVKDGDNEVVLRIYRYTAGSYLECQDFWRLSGQERDVYLSSEKKDTGFDFSVISTLTEDLSTGIFKLRMKADDPTEVAYELLDKDGSTVAGDHVEFSGRKVTVTQNIPGVRIWSAEHPELYTLLLNVNGEYTRFHVGFRRLEIKEIPDQAGKDGSPKMVKAFLVNGQPVKFKGVNLHEHNPRTGHYVTKEDLLEDLRLMKGCNINAIRTCHYPQGREFYELCDSLGFYVYDEANIETHGMGYNPDKTLAAKPEWLTKHMDRTLNMYRRTANYPCVVILSLGNESGNGCNFEETYRTLKALEEGGQNRPVVYERARNDFNSDFQNPMYPYMDWLRDKSENYQEKPVVLCEYTHAMGNSNGSLDMMWDLFYAHKHMQGGFIWDWVDQGLYDEKRGWTYGGDYGENAPSDGNFCCNGIVNPDRDPHPAFWEVKHQYQNVSITPVDAENGVFEVFNRHYFTDLKPYKITWWVERDGKKSFWWCKKTLKLETAPQAAERITLSLPKMKEAGEYRIFFEVSDGKDIVAFDQALIKDTSAREKRIVKGNIDFTDSDAQVVVRGDKVELVFDKKSGIIRSWKVKGKDVVDPKYGVKPNYWRDPVDNDYGSREVERSAAYFAPSAPDAVKVTGQDNTVVIQVKGKGVRATETYTVYPDGTLKIAVRTQGIPGPTDRWNRVFIPRLGFRFFIAGERFSYFGRGPKENYWDRNTGSFKRIWESSAKDEYYPYVRPQEYGHHTDVNWLDLEGLAVTAAEPFEFNVIRRGIPEAGLALPVDKPQSHIGDVQDFEATEVCIDYKMTGVGGLDSWKNRPEPERCLWEDQSYSYSFTLTPGMKGEKAARYE